ncbi:MAG: phytoene/squalene synthase family protein [Acidobacteriota bacterium]
MGREPAGVTLEASYEHCRTLARGSSFYPAFFLVDAPRRRALWAIYAFNRRCDDLSDGPNASLEALETWRVQLDQALAGRPPEHAIWPAFIDSVARFEIPHSCFYEMIEGVGSDLRESTKATYDDLYRYCYRVASVVGISVVSIFGAHTAEAHKLAEQCGVAVQLTNILRDVAEDQTLGRVYLPQEDLTRFGVTAIAGSPAMRDLLRFEASRARELFAAAVDLTSHVVPRTRPCLRALLSTYAMLLDKIEERHYDVFTTRVRLTSAEKLLILAKALLKR